MVTLVAKIPDLGVKPLRLGRTPTWADRRRQLERITVRRLRLTGRTCAARAIDTRRTESFGADDDARAKRTRRLRARRRDMVNPREEAGGENGAGWM